MLAVCTGVAAGTFVYVALVDVLLIEFQNQVDKYWYEQTNNAHRNQLLDSLYFRKFLLVLIGFALNASLVLIFDEHGHE